MIPTTQWRLVDLLTMKFACSQIFEPRPRAQLPRASARSERGTAVARTMFAGIATAR